MPKQTRLELSHPQPLTLTTENIEAILTAARETKPVIGVRIGKRQFTGTVAALDSETPCIFVTLPVSKTGACVEVCESFSRRTVAFLLMQGFINWPTTSHSRMKPVRPLPQQSKQRKEKR
jgi:hypothetical protein